MPGMTEQSYRNENDEEQFQSALRSMVVITQILFKAGYFLGIPKRNLIPEKESNGVFRNRMRLLAL